LCHTLHYLSFDDAFYTWGGGESGEKNETFIAQHAAPLTVL
jgi:hypothetical protein